MVVLRSTSSSLPKSTYSTNTCTAWEGMCVCVWGVERDKGEGKRDKGERKRDMGRERGLRERRRGGTRD